MRYRTYLAASLGIGVIAVGTATLADPVPRIMQPIRIGGYDTSFGTATLSVDEHPAGGSPYPVVMLQFAPRGQVMFGKVITGDERVWQGDWITTGARPLGARDCGRSYPGPRSHYTRDTYYQNFWGSFKGRINADGRSMIASWSSCGDPVTYNPLNRNNFRASLTPPPTPQPAPPPPPPTKRGQRNGPCNSFLSTAVVTLSPCYFANPANIEVRLRRDAAGYVDGLIFTPAVRSPTIVRDAIARNMDIPRDPDAGDIFADTRTTTFRRSGQMIYVAMPTSMCSHDYWSVKVRESAGAINYEQGVIVMGCGPSRLPNPGRP